ncbi:MAG: hypothetical protein OEM52_13235 [bacterium]|nr:hypothetical protein [bacterium]
MTKKTWSEEELEVWAAKLPHTGPRTVSRIALDRISTGVVARLERKRTRRRILSFLWQPAGVAAVTIAFVALFLLAIPEQTPQNEQRAPGSLLSSFAPEMSDSEINTITDDDLAGIVSEVTSDPVQYDTDLLASLYSISSEDMYIDIDASMQKLSKTEQAAVIEELKNDTSLDWSELL